MVKFLELKKSMLENFRANVLMVVHTQKYGDVYEKIQDLRPLNKCWKHFETIVPNHTSISCYT